MGVTVPTAEEIAARHAIMDVIHRCAHALDRRDAALLLSCWHPDGTDEHPPFYSGTAKGFVAWVIPTLSAMISTRHAITNTLIECDGNRATAESYWSATLRMRREDRLVDLVREGRYLDRFERRDGVWALLARSSVTDFSRVHIIGDDADADATKLISPGFNVSF